MVVVDALIINGVFGRGGSKKAEWWFEYLLNHPELERVRDM